MRVRLTEAQGEPSSRAGGSGRERGKRIGLSERNDTVSEMPGVRALRITRFTVMATLQAARARRLGLSMESAYSWGLNRAIFYAVAKRGFPEARPTAVAGETARPRETEKDLYSLGNDQAYRDPKSPGLLFTIGGETQTPESFRKQVAARFGDSRNFERAWEEAVGIVGRFDDEILRSGREFYSQVYKPRRDALVAKWSEEFLGSPPPRPLRARAGE